MAEWAHLVYETLYLDLIKLIMSLTIELNCGGDQQTLEFSDGFASIALSVFQVPVRLQWKIEAAGMLEFMTIIIAKKSPNKYYEYPVLHFLAFCPEIFL